MKGPTVFPVRHLGDGTPQYNVRCHKCGRSDWASVPRGQTAFWVISRKGWLIGSRRTTDVCPVCRNEKPKRELTKPQKVAAYNRIEAQKIAEQDGASAQPLNPVLDPVMAAKIKRAMNHPGTYARENGARRVAVETLRKLNKQPDGKYFNGIDYYTYKLPGRDLWEWVLASEATPEQIGMYKVCHQKGPYTGTSKTTIKRRMERGLPLPTIMTKNTEEQPMQFPTTQEEQATQMPENTKPTRGQNARIMDALTVAYDEEAQRYKNDGSDKVLSERLGVPRIWITTIREQFFGDYDRNEAAEKHAAKLDEAIKMADAAVARLMEMAAEAEKLSNDLKAARQKYA